MGEDVGGIVAKSQGPWPEVRGRVAVPWGGMERK